MASLPIRVYLVVLVFKSQFYKAFLGAFKSGHMKNIWGCKLFSNFVSIQITSGRQEKCFPFCRRRYRVRIIKQRGRTVVVCHPSGCWLPDYRGYLHDCTENTVYAAGVRDARDGVGVGAVVCLRVRTL